MLNIDLILRDTRTCKALTGLAPTEFEALLDPFETALYVTRKMKPNRKRAVGGGQRGKLPTITHKLAFILIYLKIYPTFDVIAVLMSRARSKCCDSVKLLLPVLEKALGRVCVLPKRKIRSLDEFCQQFGGIKDLFIDGVERPVQRPQSRKRQRKLYSGKKKCHTRKNIICCDVEKRVLFMTPTRPGRRHDNRILDKSGLIENIPSDRTIWADTGFLGLKHRHSNVEMPHKRKKGQSLTELQKEENRVISSFRVVVEHAIGGYKRYKAASDIYRNKRHNLDDQFSFLAAGLWNFHLQNT